MKKVEITGIVLAGGKSSRMGTNKSLLVWKGKTLVEHAIDSLKPFCSKVVISSSKQLYDFTGCETWPDLIPQQAPMIGIYSSLKHTDTEINLILSCDMPLVSIDLLKYLLDNSNGYKITIPVNENDMLEPLCGIYSRTILPEMEKHILRKNFRLHEFIETCSPQLLTINKELPFYKEDLFMNINTHAEYNKLKSE
jgi:molybdenum cofactor guanylyltransferase